MESRIEAPGGGGCRSRAKASSGADDRLSIADRCVGYFRPEGDLERGGAALCAIWGLLVAVVVLHAIIF